MFSTLSALLLILQLTSSGGIIAHELEQPWFRIGVALPFYLFKMPAPMTRHGG